MQILNNLADEGKVDGNIAKDIDIALAHYDGGHIPPPVM